MLKTLAHKSLYFFICLTALYSCGEEKNSSGIRSGLKCSYSIMPCPFGETCIETDNSIECVPMETGTETGTEAGIEANTEAMRDETSN